MREACKYNKWCFCFDIFDNLQGINEMNPLEFFWGVGVAMMNPHDGGTHLEWGVEGRGWGFSPKFFRMWVYLIHLNTFLRGSTHFTFHVGSLISYIYISCFHDDVIKWTHVPRHWLLCGEFTGDCGNSPVTGEFPSHRQWRLNKRLSKQSRRRWFETPSRSLWRHCNVVPNSDPMIRAAAGSYGVQRVTLVQFLMCETGQIGGFRALWKEWPQTWHTALPWLPFLEINYILHSAAV